MSLLPRLARTFLILHALLNIAQGLYCITNPQGWVDLAGPLFDDSPVRAVLAIGKLPYHPQPHLEARPLSHAQLLPS